MIPLSAPRLCKALVGAVCLPFIVLLLPVVALGVCVIFVNWSVYSLFHRVRWLRHLRRKGRSMPAAMFLANTKEGTLIVDRPGLHFRTSHCWWTKESVVDCFPAVIPTDDDRMEQFKQSNGARPHEFDLWCWRRYLSRETGSAILITPAHDGEAMATVLRERLPTLSCVKSWSAVAALSEKAVQNRVCDAE